MVTFILKDVGSRALCLLHTTEICTITFIHWSEGRTDGRTDDELIRYHPKQKMRNAVPSSVATACLTRGLAWSGRR